MKGGMHDAYAMELPRRRSSSTAAPPPLHGGRRTIRKHSYREAEIDRQTYILFTPSLFKQVQPPTGIKRERVWNRVSCSSQNRACYKGDISGDHCKPTRKYGNTSTQILYTKHIFSDCGYLGKKRLWRLFIQREKKNITIIFTSVGYGRKLSKCIWIASKQKVTATQTKPGSQRIKSTRMSTNLLIVDAKKSLYPCVCVSCSL